MASVSPDRPPRRRWPSNGGVQAQRRKLLLLLAGFFLAFCLLSGEQRTARLKQQLQQSAAILVEEGKQEAQVLGQQVYEILPFKDLYSGAHSRAVLAAQDDAQRRMQEALVPQPNPCLPHRGILYEADLLPDQPPKQGSAELCCAECQERSSECNVWQWCGLKEKCGDSYNVCQLKRSQQPTQPAVLRSGPEVPWTSGVIVTHDELPEDYARRGMALVSARTMLLGVRRLTGTLSVISPRGEPAFSFAAPHDLHAMNRSAPGFHHIGDISLRVRSNDSSAAYKDISTVTRHGSAGTARPIDTLPAGSEGRGVHIHAHVDLTSQLPLASPVSITRWIEVPDVEGATLNQWPANPQAQAQAQLGKARSSALLDNEVRMYWNITHASSTQSDLELGSVALSMPFDQIFVERTLELVAMQASFVEAYPGGEFGYIQVTKASGEGPTLLVLPAPDTPTSFEAWRPLKGDDPSPVGFGFEGHHEVLVHSKAWAEKEWHKAQPWVPPTSKTLKPGESVVLGVRFLLAHGPKQVEAALLAAGHPVVIGMPGFVLHADMETARLFIKLPTASLTLETVQSHPHGALLVNSAAPWGDTAAHAAADPGVTVKTLSIRPTLTQASDDFLFASSSRAQRIAVGRTASRGGILEPRSWERCRGRYRQGDDNALRGEQTCPGYLGRVRLQLRFKRLNPPAPRWAGDAPAGAAAGPVAEPVARASGDDDFALPGQHVHLIVLEPARALVRQYGLTSAAPGFGWLPKGTEDPYGRAPAFMGYDNELREPLLYELRVYMAGLSDESGAGQPLAMAIKQLGSPSRDQIDKLEEYVHSTLLTPQGGDYRRHIQNRDTHTVRASMLYNTTDPTITKGASEFLAKCANQTPWWQICWSEERALSTWRAFNYPHVAAVYWTLYRLARVSDPPLATRAEWDWYLRQAVHTMRAMWEYGKGYGKWGLVVGSVWRQILHDVKREGWVKEQRIIEDIMKERLAFWQSLTFPFGSEMAWDNTGHEEIAAWLSEAGDTQGEATAVQAITAYDGLHPSWALSGSARRWWDFFINGKLNQGNERVYHHYAAALNAMPLTEYYRKHPQDLHLLRLSTAGYMGSMTNLLPDGGASMGWHGDPAVLKQDGYSADYGMGFYGYWSQASGTLTCDDALGWLCYNCDITQWQPPTLGPPAHSTSPCAVKPRVQVALRDAFRRQVFIAPLALLITVDNAWITKDAQIDFASMSIVVIVAPHDLSDGFEGTTHDELSLKRRYSVHATVTVQHTVAAQDGQGPANEPALTVACGLGAPQAPEEPSRAMRAVRRPVKPPRRLDRCSPAGRGESTYRVPIDNTAQISHVVITWAEHGHTQHHVAHTSSE